MSKLVSKERLAQLASGLFEKLNSVIDNESQRAMSIEAELRNYIEDVERMLGGRSLVYLTQEEYDKLSQEEKENNTIVYNIITTEEIAYATVVQLELLQEYIDAELAKKVDAASLTIATNDEIDTLLEGLDN